MPRKSPFHDRTAALCTSYRWKEWAGYYAVCSFDTCHEREYYAIRHGAAMFDVTPLYKYEVTGPDAGAFLSRIMVKDMSTLEINQVTYTCWCDDGGHVVDDGTVMRLGDEHFRVTAAEPSLSWFDRYRRGFRVDIADISREVASLALQGPNSREILRRIVDFDIDGVGFFRMQQGRVGASPAIVTRTGYTGDLGYEVWVANHDALGLWDDLIAAGKGFGLEPAGLDALDVSRVEAGFIMNGVDYFSAHHCLTERRKSTPYELGLGWCVKPERAPFNGQEALLAERNRGPSRHFVGLLVDWPELEELFLSYGLPPEVCSSAWRTGVPIYNSDDQQVGFATSGAWSPILKQNLALATINRDWARLGNDLRFEVTVEYERRHVKATIVKTPFFNPERKRS